MSNFIKARDNQNKLIFVNLDKVSTITLEELSPISESCKWTFNMDTGYVYSETFNSKEEAVAWLANKVPISSVCFASDGIKLLKETIKLDKQNNYEDK